MTKQETYDQVVKLHETMDARIWAEEFIKNFGSRLGEIDEGLMIGWFANSIMTGHDHAFRKQERKIEKLKSLILLTDPVVSHKEMNELTTIQWDEFTRWKEEK